MPQGSLLKKLNEHWPVIAAVLGATMVVGSTRADISYNAERIATIDEHGTNYDRSIGADTRERLARLEQKVDDQTEILKDIKSDLQDSRKASK